MRLMNKRRKKIFVIAIGSVIITMFAMLGFIEYADWAVRDAAAGRVSNTPASLPAKKVGLVLGCAPWSWFFQPRIAAAAELFNRGKVEYLLVSGDNSRRDYDEPTAMQVALVSAGVPSERIIRDYAGFRTLDSLIRADKVFQENELIVISQRFHVERALYLAQRKKITALGFCAADPPAFYSRWSMGMREKLARVNAVLDVALGAEPKFLGIPIVIGK